MLDIRFVRENPDAVKENIRKKFQDAKLPLVDEVIALDAEYRAAIGEASDLRANRNKLSKQIGALMGQAKKDPSKAAEAEEIKKQVTAQADRLKELEAKETELQAKIQEIMYTIPQMIDPSVPIGPDDSCNVEVQRFGEPVVPDYPIPYHVDIMDGTFVPNFGMSVRELEMIRRITDAGHHKLIDCHMMIMNPHRYIKRIAEAGADIIYIHPESELIPSATLELIQLEGKKTGLILNPCTSLETVKDMLPITDYVMIMAVNPGFAGREFMPYTRQKFIELDNYRKEKGLNYHLMLDGGATREVIADLYHNCNVEGFVLGKQELFFQQDDYATCIDRIRTF